MKNVIVFSLLSLLFIACRKDSDRYEGPSIQDLYGEFAILSPFAINNSQVDFVNGGSVYFTAGFNKPVNWTITITGKTSHAQKIITGQSKQIDETNALWNGSTTIFPVFAAEDCIAMLTIEDVLDTFYVNLKTLNTKQNDGLVIADFENGMNPLWTVFIQTGANMDFSVHTDSLAPHGHSYLNMQGTVNWDWLIALIDFNAKAYTSTSKVLPLGSDPESEYFNCIIYGVPNTNTTRVLFQFKEDENENGTFDPTSEDQYDLEIVVNWVGWKLITVKYADLATLVNGQPAIPKGNGIKEPNKIGLISLLDLADPSKGKASAKIDYIIFTNTPLEP